MLKTFITGLTTLLLSCQVVMAAEQQPSISIVIDDMGNNLALGQRALALPGPITFSVLPFSPYSAQLATQAVNQHREIMLHMPMANENQKPLGPHALTEDLAQPGFIDNLNMAIAAIPGIKGLNNHMGSLLTRDRTRMNWLMTEIQSRPLYFLDSRTTAETVAAQVAVEHHIPTLNRDVFLDNDPSPAAIHAQFIELIRIARDKGSAVAIGHPYPTTLGYLETVLPQLDSLGIQLVTPSGLLAIREKNDSDRNTWLASGQTQQLSACSQSDDLTRLRFKCGS